MEKRRALYVQTTMIIQLQKILELVGLVLRKARFAG